MNRKKVKTEVSSILVTALTPRMEETTKRQMHSLITLVISIMFFLMPFTADVAAQPVSYQVIKNATAVNGIPGGNVTAAGDRISYQIIVNNTAEVDLTNVTVNDTMIGIINNVTNLGMGSNETLYGNYTVIQADIDNNGNGTGFIINNVTVVCDQNTTATNATATVPITSCTIVKTVIGVTGDGNGNVTAAGDIISYQINVNNTAGIPLTNVTVTDPLIGGLLNVTNLGVGSNETLYGNYTVTQSDIDNNGNGTGFIINNATVDCDQLGPKNATVTTPIKSCTIVKTVIGITGDGNGNVTAAGDIISYQINVNNTAGIPLTNVTVTDPLIGGLLNVTNLGVGSNETLYGNYTVTQSDIDNNGNGTGFIINNATVDCDQLGPKNATVTTPIESCTIVKTVIGVTGDGNGNVTAAGDIISYEINVNNTAGIPLTNVTVTDSMLGGLFNVTNLGVGNSTTLYGNYTVTQEDINNNGNGAGFIINNATVDCDQLGPKNATATVRIESDPNYSIFKSVINPDPSGDCIINSPGDEVPYRIVVKNEGNVDLTNVTVSDALVSLPDPTGDDNDDGILNPGETWEYNGIYRLTQDDINNGSVNNTATVVCDQLLEKSSSVDTPVDQSADLSIYKSVTGIDETGDHMINSPGDVITYQVAVKNNGDVDLTGVSVDDPLITLTKSSGDYSDPGVLNPGETWIYTGDYTVTQSDIDSNGDGSGFITNTATVSCNELPNESSSIQMPIIPAINFGTDTNSGSNLPVADFSTSVTSGYAPLTVQFTDKSTGSPTSWSWDFNGDGVADSSIQNPGYAYTTPGTYVAKLTVSNANGTSPKPAAVTINVLQATSSISGGSSEGSGGGSIGHATVVSSSTVNTSAAANVTQPETNTSNVEQSSTPTNVQTPEPKATSTPAKQSKRTPGFEIISGVTALLGAVYLYRRK